MNEPINEIKTFISSTFNDFNEERNILHKKVFPRIKSLCDHKHYEFLPIDLRWGVTEESSLDQKTLEICLDTVNQCINKPHPDLIILIGNRYGYVPLLNKINFELFEKIKKNIDSLNREILDFWYKLDENDLSYSNKGSYILLERKNLGFNNVDPMKKFYFSNYKKRDNWKKVENKLKNIIHSSLEKLFKNNEISKYEYDKFFWSATEHEIRQAFKNNTFDKDRVFVHHKDFQDTNIDEKEKKSIDRLLDYLKTITNNGINKISFNDKNKDFYYKEFENKIYSFLEKCIFTEVKEPLQRIQKLHNESSNNSDYLIPKEDTVKLIDMVENNNKNIKILIESGYGKTAFLKNFLKEFDKNEEYIKLTYFVNENHDIFDEKSLIINILCDLNFDLIKEKLYSIEHEDLIPIIKNEFIHIKNRKILILIDGLDYLSDINQLNFEWLNFKKNSYLTLLLSSTYNKYIDEKKEFIEFKLPEISREYASKILSNIFKNKNRTITKFQKKHILDCFERKEIGNYSPLYLKLVCDMSMNWKSYDIFFGKEKYYNNKINISVKIDKLIKYFFKSLIKQFGLSETILNHILGFISLLKKGVNSSDLLEMLFTFNDIKPILSKFNKHYKVDNKLFEDIGFPIVYWIRIEYYLRNFLSSNIIEGKRYLNFKYKILGEEYSKKLNQKIYLAHYLKYCLDKKKSSSYYALNIFHALYKIGNKKLLKIFFANEHFINNILNSNNSKYAIRNLATNLYDDSYQKSHYNISLDLSLDFLSNKNSLTLNSFIAEINNNFYKITYNKYLVDFFIDLHEYKLAIKYIRYHEVNDLNLLNNLFIKYNSLYSIKLKDYEFLINSYKSNNHEINLIDSTQFMNLFIKLKEFNQFKNPLKIMTLYLSTYLSTKEIEPEDFISNEYIFKDSEYFLLNEEFISKIINYIFTNSNNLIDKSVASHILKYEFNIQVKSETIPFKDIINGNYPKNKIYLYLKILSIYKQIPLDDFNILVEYISNIRDKLYENYNFDEYLNLIIIYDYLMQTMTYSSYNDDYINILNHTEVLRVKNIDEYESILESKEFTKDFKYFISYTKKGNLENYYKYIENNSIDYSEKTSNPFKSRNWFDSLFKIQNLKFDNLIRKELVNKLAPIFKICVSSFMIIIVLSLQIVQSAFNNLYELSLNLLFSIQYDEMLINNINNKLISFLELYNIDLNKIGINYSLNYYLQAFMLLSGLVSTSIFYFKYETAYEVKIFDKLFFDKFVNFMMSLPRKILKIMWKIQLFIFPIILFSVLSKHENIFISYPAEVLESVFTIGILLYFTLKAYKKLKIYTLR